MKVYDLFEFTLPADIRQPSENVRSVLDANFTLGRIVGKRTVDLRRITGGVGNTGNNDQRVADLVSDISSPDGYIERLIIDTQGNVIEGQHRFDALYKLGAKKVPVVVIEDYAVKYPIKKMGEAIREVGSLHSEQVDQLVIRAIEAIIDSGTPEKALEEHYIPGEFGKYFHAAISAAIT